MTNLDGLDVATDGRVATGVSSGDPDGRRRTFAWSPPIELAQAARDLAGLDFVQRMVDGRLPTPPVARCLGFRVAGVEPGVALVELEPAEFHYNPIGTMHGGVIATLCDSAVGCAIQSALPQGTGYTTLELHTTYLRAVTMGTGRVRCQGRTIHVGSRVAAAEASLTDSAGRLLAHATTTCLVTAT